MRCRKCGKENNDGAKFCAYCGTDLSMPDSAGIQSKQQLEENDKEPVNKKKRKKWIWIMLSILVLIAAVAVAGIFITRRFRERQYDNSIAEGNRYLEEMNYEKAEDFFLQAISVDPKQKEPYLKLIDIYTAQEKYDQVVETAEKAKDAVPGEEREEFEEVIKVWENMIDYTWVVEPKIEADDIFYIWGFNAGTSDNESYLQNNSQYAGIKIGDYFGLISNDGTMAVNPEYRGLTALGGQYLFYGENGSTYVFDEETSQINELTSLSFDVPENEGYYYYYYGIHNIKEEESAGYIYKEPNTAIPIPMSDKLYESLDDLVSWSKGPFAIYNNGKLMTDFIYDECGSENSGLLAVKIGGKWGYVSEDGTEIIPAEYDASWEKYGVDTEYAEGEVYVSTTSSSYCYAASEGYVVLVKDSVWEMRDTDGNLVMPGGIFEEMRPVYDGRCWVKKNGKWGVIEITEKTESDTAGSNNTNEKEEEVQGQKSEEVLRRSLESSTSDPIRFFDYDDYDGDGISEAFAVTSLENADEMGGYSRADIWFVDSRGNCQLAKADLYGYLREAVAAGDQKFLVWELSANGSGSLSYIFGLRDDEFYEPYISEKYMDFQYDTDNDRYIGYTSDFSQGYHDYLVTAFSFDRETGEFIAQ